MADNDRAFVGDLSAFTPQAIAEASDYTEGDPVEWVNALIGAEYLSRDESAPPIVLDEPVGGNTHMVAWTDYCGDPTRKRIGRWQSPEELKAAETLESLVKNGKDAKSANPVFSLYLVYKYLKRGKNPDLVHDDKWDKLNKDRQISWIRKILEDGFDGDLKKAAQAVLEIGEYFERLGVMWDASTVHKRLTDWQEKRLGR